jgi:hypothetical protein
MLLKAAIAATLPYFTLGQDTASDHSNVGKTIEWLKVYCDDDSDVISCNNENLQVAQECIENQTEDDSIDVFAKCMDDGIAAADPDALDPEFIYAETFGDIDAGNDPLLSQMLLQLNNLDMAYEKYKSQLGSDELLQVRSLQNGDGPEVDPESALGAMGEIKKQEQGIKRFVELKQLVSFMQPKDKRISRYCFYGCWCLPEGAHSFVAGEGRPVDLVDKACQYLWFCYTCAKQEFRGTFTGRYKECTPDKQKYKFKYDMDKSRPGRYDLRDIRCTDKWYHPMDTKNKWKSNCAKAICECDRGLAKRLYRSYTKWDKSRHRIWSQKVTSCTQLTNCYAMPDSTIEERDEREACIKRGCLFVVKRRCLTGNNDGYAVDHAQICCGKYEDDGGRMEQRDHGGTHACCNHDEGTGFRKGYPWAGAWYNVITNCCSNGKVFSAAAPEC